MNNMEKKEFFSLKLVTPEKIETLSDKVKYLKVRTSRGDLGVLPNHTNFMGSLGEGLLFLRTEDKEYQYFVSGGFLEVSNNNVIILAEEAVVASSEEEFKKIKAELLQKAIEAKRKEDNDILGTKKKLQDSLMR